MTFHCFVNNANSYKLSVLTSEYEYIVPYICSRGGGAKRPLPPPRDYIYLRLALFYTTEHHFSLIILPPPQLSVVSSASAKSSWKGGLDSFFIRTSSLS